MSAVEDLNQEKRITFCLYEIWERISGEGGLPPLKKLRQEDIAPFKDSLVLFDMRKGENQPTFQIIGNNLKDDLDDDLINQPVNDVPRRTMLSRVSDHYLEVIANRVPIAFEAEFVNRDNEKALYRGILMPFSDDHKNINFILGGVRWILAKDITLDDTQPSIEELMRSISDGITDTGSEKETPEDLIPDAEIAENIPAEEITIEPPEPKQGAIQLKDLVEKNEPPSHDIEETSSFEDDVVDELLDNVEDETDHLKADEHIQTDPDQIDPSITEEISEEELVLETIPENDEIAVPVAENVLPPQDIPTNESKEDLESNTPEAAPKKSLIERAISFTSILSPHAHKGKSESDDNHTTETDHEKQDDLNNEVAEEVLVTDETETSSEEQDILTIESAEESISFEEEIIDELVEATETDDETSENETPSEDKVSFEEYLKDELAENTSERIETEEAELLAETPESLVVESVEESVSFEEEIIDELVEANEADDETSESELPAEETDPLLVEDENEVISFSEDVIDELDETADEKEEETELPAENSEALDESADELELSAEEPESLLIESVEENIPFEEDIIDELVEPTEKRVEATETENIITNDPSDSLETEQSDTLSLDQLRTKLKQIKGYISKEDASHNRSRDSLYNILEAIYRFHKDCESSPSAYEELIKLHDLKAQSRAPFTPVLKICLGKDYDKTRLTEYAAALGLAQHMNINADDFQPFLKDFPSGIKGCVKEMRAIRKNGAPSSDLQKHQNAQSLEEAKEILNNMPSIGSFKVRKIIVKSNADDFCLLLAKRNGPYIDVLKVLDEKYTNIDPILKRAAFIKNKVKLS